MGTLILFRVKNKKNIIIYSSIEIFQFLQHIKICDDLVFVMDPLLNPLDRQDYKQAQT